MILIKFLTLSIQYFQLFFIQKKYQNFQKEVPALKKKKARNLFMRVQKTIVAVSYPRNGNVVYAIVKYAKNALKLKTSKATKNMSATQMILKPLNHSVKHI